MSYAVIQTGGKQYKVSQGDVLEVERLNVGENEAVMFEQVLMVVDGADVKLGAPFLDNVTVSGKVLSNMKGEKIRVAKFKAKARHRRVTGHRQSLSRVQIDSIGESKKASKKS